MLPFKVLGSEDGPTIVFLHVAGFSGAMWRPVTQHLTSYRCVLMDLPGHGAAVDQPFLSFQEAAASVARTVAERVGGPVHIVGLSLGAYVGLRVVLNAPDTVQRAVLSGFHVGEFPNPVFNRVLATALSPLATTNWYRRLAAKSLKVPPDAIFGGSEPTPVSARALRAVLREALAVQPAPEVLAEIEIPMLAVAGERELPVIRQGVALLEQTVPAVTGRIASGLGHGWCAQAPALFAEAVEAFLTGRPLPHGLAPPA